MSKTVGFFGGTFDPIHFGHINLALQLFEIHHLDAVLFCPAHHSPFKAAAPPHVNAQHRLEMVRIALEGISHFRTTTYEVDRSTPSFTIDTLRAIQKAEKGDVTFRLLLSEEAATRFDEWKDAQDLIRLAPPLIGLRSSASLKGSLASALRPGMTRTNIFEISGTNIRMRLKQGLYCGHLVPAKVLEYIRKNELYTPREVC